MGEPPDPDSNIPAEPTATARSKDADGREKGSDMPPSPLGTAPSPA